MVHWRAVNMEDGSWIVAAYKDGWIQVGGTNRVLPSLLNSTPLGNGAIRRPPALWERTPQGRANVLACGQSTLRVNNPTPPSFGSSVPICAIRAALKRVGEATQQRRLKNQDLLIP